PHRRDDPRRARQCEHAAPLLHLRGGLPVLGQRLRRDAHHRAPGDPRGLRALPVPDARAPGALPMTKALDTGGAWLLALVWILPFAFAVWTAVHPSAYTAHFDPLAPLTTANFVAAWHAAPFARYLLNTCILVTMILAAQLVVCTLAAYAFARFEFAGKS